MGKEETKEGNSRRVPDLPIRSGPSHREPLVVARSVIAPGQDRPRDGSARASMGWGRRWTRLELGGGRPEGGCVVSRWGFGWDGDLGLQRRFSQPLRINWRGGGGECGRCNAATLRRTVSQSSSSPCVGPLIREPLFMGRASSENAAEDQGRPGFRLVSIDGDALSRSARDAKEVKND